MDGWMEGWMGLGGMTYERISFILRPVKLVESMNKLK